MEVVLAGPKLTVDELRPYAKPGQPKRVISESVGRQGRVMVADNKPVYGRVQRPFLHVKTASNRTVSVTFEHGSPVEMVDAGSHYLIRDKAA